MIRDRASTASTLIDPLSCLPPWRAAVDSDLVCGRSKVGAVPIAQLQLLLDSYYSRPTRDVFKRVVAASHHRERLWLPRDGDGLLGLGMVSPHSKCGEITHLTVTPSAPGRGIGKGSARMDRPW